MSCAKRGIGTVLAAMLLVVLACGNSKAPRDETITVAGKVMYGTYPIPGANVVIPGIGSQTSGSDGSFTFAGVRPPYDIGVGLLSKSYAVFYQSLRSATPRLFVPFPADDNRKATVSGTVVYPNSSAGSHRGLACLRVEESSAFPDGTSVEMMDWDFQSQLRWYGSESVSASLHAIGYALTPSSADYPHGLPTGEFKYAKIPVSLKSGDLITGQSLTLSDVASATVNGTISTPVGYAVDQKLLDFACTIMVWDETLAAAFSYAVPSLPEGLLTLTVNARDEAGASSEVRRRLAPGASGVAIDMAPATTPSGPADGANLVDFQTLFSWSEVTGSVYFTIVYPSAEFVPLLFIVTPNAYTTLPDAAAVGIPLPKGTTLKWIAGTLPGQTMEGVVTTDPWWTAPESAWTFSSPSGFTTAP